MSPWQSLDARAIAPRLAELLDRQPGIVRCALDGPPCAGPDTVATDLVDHLHRRGRPAVHIRSQAFWRDRSLRYEYGREDVQSYRCWLDADALRREVLDAVVSSGSYLPSLRDPGTNRSTRANAVEAPPDLVILISGTLLLGDGLPFDRKVHLAVSAAARSRRTPADQRWTLPAFDDYDKRVRPEQLADVVVKLDDPRHPAVRGL